MRRRIRLFAIEPLRSFCRFGPKSSHSSATLETALHCQYDVGLPECLRRCVSSILAELWGCCLRCEALRVEQSRKSRRTAVCFLWVESNVRCNMDIEWQISARQVTPRSSMGKVVLTCVALDRFGGDP